MVAFVLIALRAHGEGWASTAEAVCRSFDSVPILFLSCVLIGLLALAQDDKEMCRNKSRGISYIFT